MKFTRQSNHNQFEFDKLNLVFSSTLRKHEELLYIFIAACTLPSSTL